MPMPMSQAHACKQNSLSKGSAAIVQPSEIEKFLGIQLHLLRGGTLVVILNLVDSNIFANVFPSDDLLVEHGGGAPLEPVVALLLCTSVGCLVVPQKRRLLVRNDTDVNVATGAEIVPDTGLDCI